MLIGLGVLGLGRIDQAEKFVDLEALRNARQQLFQLDGGFREMAGVVLGYGGLELPVEIVGWRLRLRGSTRWQRQRPRQKHQRPHVSHHHNVRMLAPAPDRA